MAGEREGQRARCDHPHACIVHGLAVIRKREKQRRGARASKVFSKEPRNAGNKKGLATHRKSFEEVEDRGLEPLKEYDANNCRETTCDESHHPSAARALHGEGANRLSLALIDADLQWLVRAWPALPEAVRRPIIALTQACQPPAEQSPTAMNSSNQLEELCWSLARDCRGVVQACLREEEWRDADAEFFDAIYSGLQQVSHAKFLRGQAALE